jgi:hypothetical protein
VKGKTNMKKAHKGLLAGGIVAGIAGLIGTAIGGLLLSKKDAMKAIGGKVAGEDDDMGAENDPIVELAKTL